MFICSQSNSGEGNKYDDKLPKVNWLQHVDAHDKFSCQNKFLCTNFLFSLERQKPCTRGAMVEQYVTVIYFDVFLWVALTNSFSLNSFLIILIMLYWFRISTLKHCIKQNWLYGYYSGDPLCKDTLRKKNCKALHLVIRWTTGFLVIAVLYQKKYCHDVSF